MIVNKNIKVIVSDLDGTLLNSNHTISDRTISVFSKLHLHNYLIIVATGRHHLDAMPILNSLVSPFIWSRQMVLEFMRLTKAALFV
jgi:HAD superfamily hydrolase (TIGR01484 family)